MEPTVLDLPTILIIAVGLSMDALAVSIASGFAVRRLHFGHAFRLAAFFGLFQALMPVVGWLAGLSVQQYIAAFDHWLAFGLLSLVGARMIAEARGGDPESEMLTCQSLSSLLLLSVATSLDALAVGLSLSMLRVRIAIPVVIIGLVTFAFSLGGVYLGERIGLRFGRRLAAGGGVVLILIGLRIVAEHILRGV